MFADTVLGRPSHTYLTLPKPHVPQIKVKKSGMYEVLETCNQPKTRLWYSYDSIAMPWTIQHYQHVL